MERRRVGIPAVQGSACAWFFNFCVRLSSAKGGRPASDAIRQPTAIGQVRLALAPNLCLPTYLPFQSVRTNSLPTNADHPKEPKLSCARAIGEECGLLSVTLEPNGKDGRGCLRFAEPWTQSVGNITH